MLIKNKLVNYAFLGHVHLHKDDFLNRLEKLEGKYSWIKSNEKRQREYIVERLNTGKVLNQMLEEFRELI